MANVANTKATGPASKDTVSGGKKFPVKESTGAAPRGNGFDMGNTSDGARSKIMSMRYNPDGQHSVTESDFTGKRIMR